jgi:hypothetical protein
MTPWSFVVAGILLIVVGFAAMFNYRGLGDWYRKSGYRLIGREGWATERGTKWDRFSFKCGIGLGVVLLLTGLLSF